MCTVRVFHDKTFRTPCQAREEKAASVHGRDSQRVARPGRSMRLACTGTPVRYFTNILDAVSGPRQGLTLVYFSAQLEPCLTQENTLHTLNTA